MVGCLLAGMAAGFTVAYIILFLVKGMPLNEFLKKMASTSLQDLFGIPVLAVLFLFIAVFLHIILHESGHLVCGLLTGYRFVSFRILSLTLIRREGRLRIKRFNIEGTGGQCLLTPPEKPIADIPCTLYNLGGVLANLLFSLLALVPILIADDMPNLLLLFLIMFVLVGILLGLINGIPLRMNDISNDAENMRQLRKNPQSKRALVMQLRINAQVQEGLRPCEMPAKWFQWEDELDYKNELQVNHRQMCIGLLIDKEEWEAAYNELEELMTHEKEIIGLLCNEIRCELLCAALVTGRAERAEQLCTPELMRHINTYKQVMSGKQRLLCTLALYREKNVARAKEIYDYVCSRQEEYLMQGEVRSDIALMKTILTRKNVL